MEKWHTQSLGECKYRNAKQSGVHFVRDEDLMFRSSSSDETGHPNSLLERAGPREHLFFEVSPEFTVGRRTRLNAPCRNFD